MIAFSAAIIAFSFFIQSLLGFGGGLICIPLLSLYMPVQQAVTLALVFQFFMGILIIRTWRKTDWGLIRALGFFAFMGLVAGLALLHVVPEKLMMGLLIVVITLHLVKSRLNIDVSQTMVSAGGRVAAGFFGGAQQALLGTGGPALVVYLKEESSDPVALRANAIAMLFFLNLPRLATSITTGLVDQGIINIVAVSFPLFLGALWLGQRWHDKIPSQPFYLAVDGVLAASAVMLLMKLVAL